jgi:hypothetical protein
MVTLAASKISRDIAILLMTTPKILDCCPEAWPIVLGDVMQPECPPELQFGNHAAQLNHRTE